MERGQPSSFPPLLSQNPGVLGTQNDLRAPDGMVKAERRTEQTGGCAAVRLKKKRSKLLEAKGEGEGAVSLCWRRPGRVRVC